MIAPHGTPILIADDEGDVRETLAELLRREGYRVSTVSGGAEALKLLRQEAASLVIADLSMPGMDGLELTERVVTEHPTLPVMILTGHGSVELAVRAMRFGAADFLVKPVDPGELTVRIAKCLDIGNLRVVNDRLAQQVAEEKRYGKIIGQSQEMTTIFGVIERVAATPSVVLIEGEPGTGKELIARAIYDRSVEEYVQKGRPASDFPYVGVNCGAFAPTLLESQLFGHKRGSFTGAVADQEGVFTAASQGTLFLDEITELDLELQVKLLRALQEREVTPLGATRPVPVHARIITATNQPIANLVREGKFRTDLYYRINVVNIVVPALRERRDDILPLVEYFLRITAERYRVRPKTLAPDVLEVFLAHDWPGNVRELQNVIERAFALGRHEKSIVLDDLPVNLLDAPGMAARPAADEGDRGTRFPSLDRVIREHVQQSLRLTRGVKTRAASLLGIDRNRLYRLMKKYSVSDRN